MENKQKLKAISRIYRDLKEISETPIQGLSICMPNEFEPFSLYCNILILTGIYKDILLHLHMTIPENYPLRSPRLTIMAGQPFDHSFHHHVFPDLAGFTICIDLLDHGFFQEGAKTGWTPAYTLSTVLIQMQVFFAEDYDLHKLPSAEMIKELKQKLKKYTHTVKLTDGTEKTHSFSEPYPSIIQNNQMNHNISTPEINRKKQVYEKLTCFLTKINPENKESPLGYPLYLERDVYARMNIVPILEVLSYDGYIQQIQYNPEKLDTFDLACLRTANGDVFNYWLPFYINEGIYQKFKQTVLNSISILKYGVFGKKEYDFDEELILKIFPLLMNKMIVSLQKGVLHESIAAIEAYCHFLRLFLRLLEDFPNLQKRINEKIQKSLLSDQERNKANLGDLGEFLILLSLSKYGLQNKEVWIHLIKEFIARKFLWIIKEIKGFSKIFFKNDKDILEISPLSLFHGMTIENLKKVYKQRKVSNDLVLFNFAAAKKFLLNKEAFIKRMDSNYGVIEEKEVIEFLQEVKNIKNNIVNYEQFLEFIGLKEEFPDNTRILALFREAHQLSYMQKYTNFHVPDIEKGFLLKIDTFLILIQWFLKEEENKRFFRLLMREKKLIFLLKEYVKTQDRAIFAEFVNLPSFFYEFLDNKDSGFFMEKLLSQRFLFYFVTFLENDKLYERNGFALLNNMNCLQAFQDESFKKKLNCQGIFKSLFWQMILCFHEIYEAIDDNRKGKIVLLQKFAFFYKIMNKNAHIWSYSFFKITHENPDVILKDFEKDLDVLNETNEFSIIGQEKGFFIVLIIMLIEKHTVMKTKKHITNEFKGIIEYFHKYFEKNKEINERISSEILKKTAVLFLLMKELDRLGFEKEMDRNFMILEREICLKVIFHLIENSKKFTDIKEFLKSI